MSEREPTLTMLLTAAIQSRLLEFHVMLPATIESYDAATGTVNVKILLKKQQPLPDGTVDLKDFPPIEDVPVMWQRCGKAWITMPLAQGDTGMVIFADRSLSKWNQTDKGQVVDPQTLSMHNLDGAVFMPGLTPPKNALESPDTDNVVIHTETKLDLGEKGLNDTDNLIALAKKTKDEISALRQSFVDFINNNYTGHMHPSAMGPTGNPIPAPPVIPPNPVQDVAATKVRAK